MVYMMVRDLIREIKKIDISAYAASTAFFFFLSIVPMLIMVCTIVPFTPLTEESLVLAVTELTPDVMDVLVANLIAEVYEKSAGILSIAVLTTLWSAGKGVQALMRGINAIYDVEEHRNYFSRRLIASMYTLVMLVIMILSLFVMVFGNQLVDLMLYRFPRIRVFIAFLMNFRFLAIWIILTILFAALYAYMPDVKLGFKEQIPGATFSAVSWSIFSWGFSLYVGRSGEYSIYGSLSIIVFVMIWLYFCMYILLIGAYLNRWYNNS